MRALPYRFDFGSPDWLRSLRWAAILGISASILTGHVWIGAQLPLELLGSIVGALILWNLSLPWWEARLELSARGFIVLQIVVDLSVLTAILFFSGGLLNPFAGFYIFHVMIAGLLLDRRWTIIVSALAIVLVGLTYFASPLRVRGEVIGLRESPIWIAFPIALTLLISFSTVFILGYLDRLNRSREESEDRVKMAALGGLVGGLAHELGTPLNTILLLAKDLSTGKGGAERNDLDLIADQARRCGDLVSLLLGYSRSAIRGVASSGVSLEDWLRGIYSEAQENSSREVRPELTIRNFTGESNWILPELSLKQVVGNLFKNSLQELVDVPLARIDVTIYFDEAVECLKFLVSDNGRGFSPESRRRAFEAFFSTKSPGEGNGLGLYVSYHLMERVGGRIAIPIDLQDNGATIELLVPAKKESA